MSEEEGRRRERRDDDATQFRALPKFLPRHGIQCGHVNWASVRLCLSPYRADQALNVDRCCRLEVTLHLPILQLRNNDRLLAELREANQSLTDRLESLSRSLRGGQSLSSSPGHRPQTSQAAAAASSSQNNNNSGSGSQNAMSLLGELEQLSADSDYSTMATTASRNSSFLGGRSSSCRRCGHERAHVYYLGRGSWILYSRSISGNARKLRRCRRRTRWTWRPTLTTAR